MNIRTVKQRKNRERFILKRNEYDLMMTIADNADDRCPMVVLGAKQPNKCIPDERYEFRTRCDLCCERWLNEEYKD